MKNYFWDQGLSKEEAEQAIAAFKKQKKENEPDIDELQNQITQANTLARDAMIEKEGVLVGIGMGLDTQNKDAVARGPLQGLS